MSSSQLTPPEPEMSDLGHRRRLRAVRLLAVLLKGGRFTVRGVTYAMSEDYRVCDVRRKGRTHWYFVNKTTGEERDAYTPEGLEIELPDRGAGWSLGQRDIDLGEALLVDFSLKDVASFVKWAESLRDDEWHVLIAEVALQEIASARHT